MASFFASRPMEDFFINPIIADEAHRQHAFDFQFPMPPQTMDQASEYKAALRDYHHHRRTSSAKEPVLKDVALPSRVAVPQRMTSYLNGYQSEEEQPSPVDNDSSDSQMDETDEPISVGTDVSFGVASTVHISEEECSQAKVIMIQPAGRARVVSLPKLVTVGPRFPRRPAEESILDRPRPSISHSRNESEQSARTSHDSASTYNSSSSMHSPTSTAPSSVDEAYERPKHTRAPSKHVPLMEAARTFTPISPAHAFPPATSMHRRTKSSFSQVPYTPSQIPYTPSEVPYTPMAKPQRKKSNFSLNMAFRLGGSSKKDDERSLHSVMESETASVTSQATMTSTRKFSLSMNRNRYSPRAADYREPVIRLPPSPVSPRR